MISSSLALAGATPVHAGPAVTDGQAAPAQQQPNGNVDVYVAEAEQHYKQGDYDGAAEAFKRAYAISGDPNMLFNIGRVYEESGQFANAIEYYQKFVAQPGIEIGDRELGLARLKVMREAQAAVAPEPAPQPVLEPQPQPQQQPEGPQTPPQPAATAEDRPTKRSKGEVAGFALIGLGAAALAAGGIFGGLALSQSNRVDEQMTFENRKALLDSGRTNAAVADVFFIAGGVIAATGIILVAVGASKRRNARVAARSTGLALHF
ncbi:MAG: tetratricopeptide repeat protein [Myxococcales bacterium]|nr:tetratricopeptide repeat protein [Myxococcales bacterium]